MQQHKLFHKFTDGVTALIWSSSDRLRLKLQNIRTRTSNHGLRLPTHSTRTWFCLYANIQSWSGTANLINPEVFASKFVSVGWIASRVKYSCINLLKLDWLQKTANVSGLFELVLYIYTLRMSYSLITILIFFLSVKHSFWHSALS